ncbi:MAG: polysaccharide deacetylase family protein, partial [Candidatus Hodarchaeota archaeon]
KRDIIFDIFWLVTGQEERHWPKDKHGFFDLSGNAFFKEQILRLALASSIACWLEKSLLNLGFSSPIPRWPSDKQASACLSHDVDYPEVKRLLEPIRIIGRQGLSGLRAATAVIAGKRTHWHFSSWLQMEKNLGLHSAFYFAAVQGSLMKFVFGVPDPFYDVTSDRFKQLFRYLSDHGFEIGLHSSYLAFTNREQLSSERQILQRSTGQQIWGNRHHYWHLNPDDIESTLVIHEQIGLRYDSSLIHERYLGWRRGLSWPFFPFHQKERRELKTLQVSPTWMDNQLFGHLKHNPGDRLETLRAIIDRAVEQGGCIVVNIHNYVFDDLLFPDWRKTYLWLIENLIERSDFWIGTPGEIADHWIQRYSSILDRSRGLREGLPGLI